ncbi:MAG: 4'-phosphopantetheinyl transferase superfamily protein [Chitinophagaceae bacterium]|nr:4'-phosphopantetheinyl transferase superfamily protein [Chitinophagaceae bacterium]
MSAIHNINWQVITDSNQISLPETPFVDIYVIPVSGNIGLLSKEAILSDEEIIYTDSFLKETDRATKKISRIAIREVLSALSKIPAEKIAIRKNNFGKPYWDTINAIHFNTSDTTDAIMLGVSSAQIGVDIEFNKMSFDYKDVVADYFNEQEVKIINESLNPGQTFYQLWVRKEALTKAIGMGLDVLAIDETGWDIQLYQDDSYSLAFAVPEGNYAIRFFKYLATKF